MLFECYTHWSQLPKGADSLFEMAEKDSVFFSRHWLENLESNAKKDNQTMRLACVVDNDLVLALLPLYEQPNGHWASLSHAYSSFYSMLLVQNNQQNVLFHLVQGLNQLSFESLRLEPIANNDKNLIALQQEMEAQGFRCHRQFHFYNWVHHLQGQTFDTYIATRPNKVRNTIARKQRKLEREHGYNIRLFTTNEVQKGIDDYHLVYKESWKASEYFALFTQSVVRTLSQLGWIRLVVLYVEEKPIAAQIWFVVYDKASIYRLVYDEKWKHYSPGSILTYYLMKHVIDTDNVNELDYLTGNEGYKQDWMSLRSERWSLVCVKNKITLGWRDRMVHFLQKLKR